MSSVELEEPDVKPPKKGQDKRINWKGVRIGGGRLVVPEDIFLQFRHFKVQTRAKTDAEALSRLLKLARYCMGVNFEDYDSEASESQFRRKRSRKKDINVNKKDATLVSFGPEKVGARGNASEGDSEARDSASEGDSETSDINTSSDSASELDDNSSTSSNENQQPHIRVESTGTEQVYNITLDPSCWLFADKNTIDPPEGEKSEHVSPERAECPSYDPPITIKEEPNDTYPSDAQPGSTGPPSGSPGPPSEEDDFPSSSSDEDEDDEGYWRNPKMKRKGKPDDPDFDPSSDRCSARKSKKNMDYSSDDMLDLPDESDEGSLNRTGPITGPVENYIIEDKPTSGRRDRSRKSESSFSGQCSENGESVLDKCGLETEDGLHNESQNVKKDTEIESGSLNNENLDKTRNSIHQVEDEPALCIVCGDDFENEKEFREHTKIQHSDVQDICPYCMRWFPGQRRYICHVNICSLEKQCSTCEAEFSDKVALLSHIELEHNNLRFKCRKCEHRFATRDIAYAHVRRNHKLNMDSAHESKDDKVSRRTKHGKNLFRCPLCIFKTYIRYALVYHIWRVHKSKEKLPGRYKQFRCQICSYEFDTDQKLRDHMHIHSNERSFGCDLCSKSFKTKVQLQRHRKLHSDNKAYMCNHCGRLFKRKTYLSQHERIHTGIAAYTCAKCGKGFAQKNSYNYHMSKHHLDSADEKLSENDIESSKGTKRRRRDMDNQ